MCKNCAVRDGAKELSTGNNFTATSRRPLKKPPGSHIPGASRSVAKVRGNFVALTLNTLCACHFRFSSTVFRRVIERSVLLKPLEMPTNPVEFRRLNRKFHLLHSAAVSSRRYENDSGRTEPQCEILRILIIIPTEYP